MDLGELIAGLEVRAGGPGQPRVCDVTDDSRTVVPGSLFIARRGVSDDGRRYVPQAEAAGAVAVLTDDPDLRFRGTILYAENLPRISAIIAERFYGNPSGRLTVIGVTGTNGKTTTTFLIHRMLNESAIRCGLVGTIFIDDGREMAKATLTTPPATELSRTLGSMVEAGCRAAAIEASSHALDQDRVAGVRFRVGVFTNLTGDHLDYHATMDRYASAKARLFASLDPDALAIVNADDPWHERMVQGARCRIIRCTVGEAVEREGWCSAQILAADRRGTTARMVGPWGVFERRLLLLGRHNVMNALQAACACHAVGLAPRQIRTTISMAPAPPGRLEPVTTPDAPFAVLVDYAHSDDALRNVLTTLRPLVGAGPRGPGRLICIFGCGGQRDRSKRPRMGAAATELADEVIVTSDNPRSERPADIIHDILGGIDGSLRHKVRINEDRAQAIREGVHGAREGDIVLIAGKGHEDYQITSDGVGGTVSRHFDDREEARAALAMGGSRE